MIITIRNEGQTLYLNLLRMDYARAMEDGTVVITYPDQDFVLEDEDRDNFLKTMNLMVIPAFKGEI